MKLKPILITTALLLLPIPAKGILKKLKSRTAPSNGKGSIAPSPEG